MKDEKNKKSNDEGVDWTDTAAENIVETVGKIQTRITSPLRPLAKLLAYIPLFILAFVLVVTLIIIGVFRLVDVYLPQDTWVAHLILGGAFFVPGLILWFKRPRFSSFGSHPRK